MSLTSPGGRAPAVSSSSSSSSSSLQSDSPLRQDPAPTPTASASTERVTSPALLNLERVYEQNRQRTQKRDGTPVAAKQPEPAQSAPPAPPKGKPRLLLMGQRAYVPFLPCCVDELPVLDHGFLGSLVLVARFGTTWLDPPWRVS